MDAARVFSPDTSGTDQHYLSSARRAARESLAAEIAQRPGRAKARRGLTRARLLIFGALAPLIVAGTAIFVLNHHTVSAQAVPAIFVRVPAATVHAAASANPARHNEKVGPQPAALRNLGLDYLGGQGVPMNDAEAARLLLQAAYGGDTTAQYWLGILYAEGRGVPADAYQADHWYETAAKSGNAKAMHRFAVANFQGRGLDKNDSEAARWFRNAAERGFVDSAFNLAVLYEQGAGVPQSFAEAYKWYAVAAIGGDSEAAARLPVLAKSLRPADIALAQHAAENFHPLAPGMPVDSGK
jgi:localization factor PodJL